MHRSHADGVEAHQAEHCPIESLRLHYLADEESHPSFLLTVTGAIFTTLYTGAGKTWEQGEVMSWKYYLQLGLFKDKILATLKT